ncbi:sperm microtubule associated protein 2 [Labrus mixtus]|uniref:sperm microtubule associated protein 2 n=1 Tax=Labrus mixtus TaxID=508554 RepID=UPI0029C006CC|nr:sperm microtubule associated protein 2 [Labrus mixtus]
MLCYYDFFFLQCTRMKKLAQPKPSQLRYPDRRSVYWLDHLPPHKTGSITKTGTLHLFCLFTNLSCRVLTFFVVHLLGSFLYSSMSLALISFPALFLPSLSFFISSISSGVYLPFLPSASVTPFSLLSLLSFMRSPALPPLSSSLPSLLMFFFSLQRLSPTWEVSEWALQAVASDRLCSLAHPRASAAGWQLDRPLLAPLNRATQTAVATSRICQLAQPRRRLALEGSGHKSKPEPISHEPYRASAHIELLATPKHDHPKFRGERPVCWLVSRAARSHVADQRLLELSSPKERKALFEGYDPYRVSRAARSASPSPRIQQLSLPLPRKCSSRQEG